MDVRAVFKEGKRRPTPLRFKLIEDGKEKPVEVPEILHEEDVGAGSVSRIEYTCASAGARGKNIYKLCYYYNTGRWTIER